MKNILLHLAAAALLTGGTASAGSFAKNFTNPNDTEGFTIQGSGTLSDGSSWMPTISSDGLLLTTKVNSLGAVLVMADFDNYQPIESFTAKFQLQLDGGADGVAFAFGPDITDGSGIFGETGPGMGQGGFVVSFDLYDNGSPDAIGISTYVTGTEYGLTPMALSSTDWKDVTIQLNRNGTLNMSYGGKEIYKNMLLPNYIDVNGQFAIGARTGGVNANQAVKNLTIDTKVKGDDVAASITAQPASVSINEKESTQFSVGFDGTPPFTFQWTKNDVDIPDATSNILKLSNVLASDNGAKIKCVVSNGLKSITSSAATLSVKSDVAAPAVSSAKGSQDLNHVTVVFSKEVTTETAENTANYKIDNGVTVTSAVLSTTNQKTVVLTTSTMSPNTAYVLTLNGIKDTTSAGNPIATNTKANFKSLMFVTGTALHKKYTNVTDGVGASTANLFSDARYPNSPDRVDLMPFWEYPLGGAGRVEADPVRNYFDTIEGYFIAPATEDYVFFICGADRFWLYLSTDEDPANMHLVAAQPGGWTNPRNWITGQNTDMTPCRTDSYASTEWPDGNTIHLTKGKRYYMMSVHHDPSWCGADDFGATYRLSSETDPADGDAPKITGAVVGSYLDPSGATVNFAQQPVNASVIQGTAATFTASVTGSSAYGSTVFYQWQSAPKGSSTWTDIAGATTTTYKTELLSQANDGMQFRLVATVPPVSATSSVVTVTVLSDTTPPVATVGAMLDAATGTVNVGVAFNETVSSAVANIANYAISQGTITGITVYTNRFTENSKNPLAKFLKQSVLLTVTGLSGSGTLTVKNIADTFGNSLGTTNVPFTVDTKMGWGVVGANEFGGVNQVVPTAPNGFDVYSDGVTEWGNYDETTFVFEQVTGDFDKKVRVEYQDGSSQWARSGLIVRDVKNFGVDRAAQAGSSAAAAPYDGLAGRYQKVHVSPVGAVLTGPGTAGNGLWECNRRLDTGGATTGPVSGVNATPQYPNAWVRLQRIGQKFNSYRSDDGKNWVLLNSTTWGVDDETKTPMPATVFVGPEYSPEIGNITNESDKGTFLARFRDYGDFSVIVDPQLKVSQASGKVTITWAAGTLVSSPTVNGTYAPVTGAASPYAITPEAGKSVFYRVKL